jgi:transcriptional regulator with XRE-family HTH domain
MDIFLPIGERLKSERERLGFTQQQFADFVGVTRKTLFGYETGARAPDAAALAVWSGVGVDALFVVTGQRQGKSENVFAFESDSKNSESPALVPREEALLDNYRHSSDEGKRAVEAAASAVAQQATQKKVARRHTKK